MKKRLLASLMSLCLIVGLLPTAAFAAEADTTEAAPQAVVCEVTPGCTLEAGHEGDCMVAPVEGDSSEPGNDLDAQPGGEDVSAPVCAELAGCVDGSHDPECPLYVAPVEPEEVPAPVEPAEENVILDPAPVVENGEMSGNCGATESDNLTWELKQNNKDAENPTYTLSISGSGAMADYTNVTTPWGVALAKELDISDIMGEADPLITEINISEGITYIGNHAFRSTGISTITIPASVEKIGDYALIRCANLEEIKLAEGTNSNRQFYVEDGVLYEQYTENGKAGVELRFYPAAKTTETFEIPHGVTVIGSNSLQDAKFSGITIPNSVRSINSYALCDTKNLTSITLPDNVAFGVERELGAAPGSSVFFGSTNLAEVKNFPSVAEIPANMFSGTALSSFEIPKTVEKIGNSAFKGTSITEFTIPANVKEIGDSVFASAENESGNVKLVFSKGSQLGAIGTSCFLGRTSYTVIFDSADVNAYLAFTKGGYTAELQGKPLPEDETFLYAWAGTDTLRIVGLTEQGKSQNEITIPNVETITDGNSTEYKVVEIAADVFAGTDGSDGANSTLTKVVMGANIETIGDRAFKYCTSLATVDFSNAAALKTIGKEAFYNNKALKSIDLSSTGLTSIGDSAFRYSNVESAKLPGEISAWGTHVIDNDETALSASGNKTISTLKDVLVAGNDQFNITGTYDNLAYSIVCEENELSITITGFASVEKSKKSSIKIPDEIDGIPVKTVADYAFASSNNTDYVQLQSIEIGANVEVIGTQAFAGDPNKKDEVLNTIKFAPGVSVTIGTRAFQKYDGDSENITFDAVDRAITLGDNVFLGSKFGTINIPNAQELGNGVFHSTTSTLKTLVINGSATCAEYTFVNSTGTENTTNSIQGATIYAVNAKKDSVSEQIKKLDTNGQNILCLADGGTVDISEDSDSTTGLYSPAYEGAGQLFVGWYYTKENSESKLETTASAGNTYYAKWEESSYSVADTVSFDELIYGDTPISKMIIVSADGVENPSITSVTSSESFTASSDGLTVTITPKANLPVGTYEETIVVTTGDGATHDVTVTLTVNKAGSAVAPGEDAGDIKATYGETITFVAKVAKAENNLIAPITNSSEQDKVSFYCGENLLGTAVVVYSDEAHTAGTAELEYDTSKNGIPTVSEQTITAVYGGSINLNGSNADSIKVTLSKAQPTVDISASSASLSGGGTVTLTVDKSGLPDDATVSVTCDDVTYNPTNNGDGTYTVSLPNSTATYTFTVSYAGNEWYNAASDACTVSVTRTGGSSGGGSSSTRYTISTPSDVDNGSIKVSPSRASKGSTVTITVKPDEGYVLDELVVTDKNGDTVKLTDKGDGKYTFKMPASKVEIEVSFTLAADPDVNQPFVDVSPDAYYADAVKWAVAEGITKGTSDTTFGPDVSCTRAQMVTFLWRAAGSPKATDSNPFTDVQAGSYYYDAVLWAVEQGITSGTSATTFAPDATVTRAQTVTFLYRAAGSPAVSGGSFADVSADAYYTDAVAWAVSEGVTVGTSDTTFSPDMNCTRAQIVTFMYRAEQ